MGAARLPLNAMTVDEAVFIFALFPLNFSGKSLPRLPSSNYPFG